MIDDHLTHSLLLFRMSTTHLYCESCNRCIWSKSLRPGEDGEWEDDSRLVSVGDVAKIPGG